LRVQVRNVVIEGRQDGSAGELTHSSRKQTSRVSSGPRWSSRFLE
jgi:hypothetical protein